MKQLIKLFCLILLTMPLAQADYDLEVGYELSQSDAYEKVSKFLFWRSYKGKPSYTLLTDIRTGYETYINVSTKSKVVLDKTCYEKLKKFFKDEPNYKDYTLVIKGRLAEFKLKASGKSKFKMKSKQIEYCDFVLND
jgi:hypothetical protein